MDKVTIMSERRFAEFTPNEKKNDVVAIRICDSTLAKDSRDKFYDEVLYLNFYDEVGYYDSIDRSTPVGSNRLTIERAEEVRSFIKKHEDKKFIIHCAAGISRSSGVGFAILRLLGRDEEFKEKIECGLYLPNVEVYGLVTGRPYTRETSDLLRSELKGAYTSGTISELKF